MYKDRASRLKNYGGKRHGFLGYWSPILHPIRWFKAGVIHAKLCRIHSYLCDQRYSDEDAINIVSSKAGAAYRDASDWLG